MGIIELKFADPNSKSFARSSSYKFEQTTEDFLAEDITLMDPLDHRNVFIANSGKFFTTCWIIVPCVISIILYWVRL